MKISKIIISIFLLASLSLSGQSISVKFGANGIQFPDTITLGDTVYYSCWVVNSGGNILNDNIFLKTANYSQFNGLTNERSLGCQGFNFLYPNDSIQFVQGIIYEVVTQNNYLLGDNIVVIWPKVSSPNSQSTQHEYKNVYVQGPSMISSVLDFNEKLKLFPIPANNEVIFDSDMNVIKVQIFNVLGKELDTYFIENNVLNTTNFKDGIYLINAQFKDGTSSQNKFKIQH